MQYRLNKGNIQLPETWVDETIYIFKAPEEEGYNIVVNQNLIPHGIEGAAFLHEQYVLLQENLTEYHETDKQQLELAQTHQFIEYNWQSPEGKVYQLNLMLIEGNTLLSFTATSTTPLQPEKVETIIQIFTSYKT